MSHRSSHRETCRICGAQGLVEYLSLGRTPLANSYLKEEELAREEFKEELSLQLCQRCGLSQLSRVVHPDRMFRHYLYVSSTTETFRRHCLEFASSAIAVSRAKPGEWVLDIASNDGCLLSQFRDLGMNVVGVDPAENLAQEATAAGIPTLCAYWSCDVAKDVASRFAPLRMITATNVLAHVDDVHEFVEAVTHSLAPQGIFVVECPYVVDFIEKNEFDTAYHEHLSYLSIHALVRLVKAHGLHVFNVEYFEALHGGTIRVWVSRPHDYAVDSHVESFLARERAFGLHDLAPYEAFARRVRTNKQQLVTVLERLQQRGKTVWAYGASAKGNTLVNYFGISRELVPVVIDDNSKKWGWLTPGAHMRIVGIDELAKAHVDYLVLLAWNFQTEIMRRCQEVGYAGGFILPVPRPQVLDGVGHAESRVESR